MRINRTNNWQKRGEGKMQFEVDLSLKRIIQFIACVIIFVSVVKHISDAHTQNIREINAIKARRRAAKE